MKKIIALASALVLCIACVSLAACGEEKVSVDEISIVAPAATEYKAGETFTLDYITVPESAAEKVKVNWEISDSRRLSYNDGKFTALTCGTVKVTASVKGCEATDEIELKVTAPEGFKEYSGTGYSLVFPSNWNKTTVMGITTWTAGNGTTNMNITTEELNQNYFSASASAFQTVIETAYALMGVNFTKPVTIEKSTYLGVERIQVNYEYSLTMAGITTSLRQTQMIFNNSDANLSCVLTVTFQAKDFDEEAQKLQEKIFSQFMPL